MERTFIWGMMVIWCLAVWFIVSHLAFASEKPDIPLCNNLKDKEITFNETPYSVGRCWLKKQNQEYLLYYQFVEDEKNEF